MKQTPRIFSTEEVQAILKGNKTQIRIVVKPQPKTEEYETVYEVAKGDWWVGQLHNFPQVTHFSGNSSSRFKCPYGKVGDVIWVRETWSVIRYSSSEIINCGMDKEQDVIYKASHDGVDRRFTGWKPSIHMPKEACRLWLEITDIRVERLKDISEEDAISEGVKCKGTGYENYADIVPLTTLHNARESFHSLWVNKNGLCSLVENPWVWAITFKRIEKP